MNLQDERVPGGGVGRQVTLGGATDSSGNPAVNTVTELNPITGTVEYADVFFDAAADLPADPTSVANVLADLVRITGFTAGEKRCRVTYHYLSALGSTADNPPFAIGARACINSPDTTDASEKLAITDQLTGSGVTLTPIDGAVAQTITMLKPAVEWDLTGTDYDINDVYLVGIAPDTETPLTNALVTVEVW